MSDREQSPPMDVARDDEDDGGVKRQPADGEQGAPADGGKRQTADGEQKAPADGEQQVDGGQMELDGGEEEEYDGEEEDDSDGEEEESDVGDEESDTEMNESDGEVDQRPAGGVDQPVRFEYPEHNDPADEAPRVQYDYVYLRLISDIHPDECFLVKNTEPMRNMKQLHHSQLNEDQKQTFKEYFLYNGNLIADEDTPQSLGVKETDDIHVFHTMGEGICVETIETGEIRQLQL